MSATNYAQMSTDGLIHEFIDKANIIGGAWNFNFKIHKRTPERKEMVQDIYAISAELITRNSIAQVRPLFDHESRDVRSWAAGQFLTIDPEWASATFSGLAAGLSTRDVLALVTHARQGPPAHPTLGEMSTDQLVERFQDAGMREYATQFLGDGDEPWDVGLRNRIITETSELVRELKSRNAVAGLLPFIDHPNITVRRKAATHCLALAPERAVPTLEAIVATKDSFELGAASWTLDRWRKGE